MLAIGRALLTNPTLLVMDEPSEGLAPAIVEQLIETFGKLVEEGLAVLLIEQNLGVATSIADRLLVMVAGSLAAETTAAELTPTSSCSAGSWASSRSRERPEWRGRPRRHARHEGRRVRLPARPAARARNRGARDRRGRARAGRHPPGRRPRRGRARRRRRRRGARAARRSRRRGRGDGRRRRGRGAAAARRGPGRRRARARRLGRLVDRDARDARAPGRGARS